MALTRHQIAERRLRKIRQHVCEMSDSDLARAHKIMDKLKARCAAQWADERHRSYTAKYQNYMM